MLTGSVLYCPHAFNSPLVMHVDVFFTHAEVGAARLLFRVKAPAVMPAGLGNIVGQGNKLLALRAHGFLVKRCRKAGEKRVPEGLRVIDRYVHLRDGHGLGQRNHKRRRKYGLRDAYMGQGVGHAAQCGELHAPGLAVKADVGLRKLAHDARHGPLFAIKPACAGASELLACRVVANLAQGFVLQKSVQKGRMRGVNADFKSLQPVGVPQALEGKAVSGRSVKAVKGRKGRWCRVLVAQPRKQHATSFNHRVAALPDALAQFASGRFRRRFQAAPIGSKFPAMKRTAQAAALRCGFKAAKGQIGTAMRAVAVQQAPVTRCVLEQHQVLAQ